MTGPLPDVLTREEAVRYLRLDSARTKDPGRTLDRYRHLGLLRAVRIGRCYRFPRAELDRFLAVAAERQRTAS